MARAILLLSGGLDSVASAWLLPKTIEPVLGLTVDYGQKAARRELAASYSICIDLGIAHRTIFLPYLREASSGALTDPLLKVPHTSTADLDDPTVAAARAAMVWVPNRNLSFIAMAATWAEVNGIDHVICGFNAEEARTFPDNSEAFVTAVNQTLAYSTRTKVTVIAPTIAMEKTEIARRAFAAGAPLHKVWSCYLGGDRPCRECESCRRFERALEAAGIPMEEGRALPVPRAL